MNNRFSFIVPAYNASNTLARMLHSIVGQSYANWNVIVIDDVSSASHTADCVDIVEHFRSLTPEGCSIGYHINMTKKWEVANVLSGISMCDDDDIICRIDGDDWLVDLDALYILNYAYEQTGSDAIWTAHRWGFTDQNISAPMPDDADPYSYPWVSSHLKTFRKRLINDINDVNFRGEDGEYIKRAGDQAIYLPILKRAKKRLFVPRVMYHYTIDLEDPTLFTKDDSKFQKNEADFIRKRGFVK